MARPRLPNGKAEATGAIAEHPKRFAQRKEPKTRPLGKAPTSLKKDELVAWEAFVREVPWLTESDRALLEIASRLRAEIWRSKKDLPLGSVNALCRLLSKMGMTPTDRSRIVASIDDTETADEAYFDS